MSFSITSNAVNNYFIANSWIGLTNWIPYFFIVWAIQPYISTYESRRNTSILILSGSIPLFFSIFGQYWFNWHGPFNLLNGFIVWFQRPITYDFGATGLFNNQNYTAAWLLSILPTSLALIRESNKNKISKLFIFFITLCIFISIYLTKSRSGLFGSLIGSLLLASNKYLLIIIPILLLFITTLIFALVPIIPNLQPIALSILPPQIISRFKLIGFSDLNYPRYLIWQKSIELIGEKPFVGWGAASFPILYESSFSNTWRFHTHNLFLELSQNYGILPAIILVCFFLILIVRSFKIIYKIANKYDPKKNKQNSIFDKAWWSTAFLLIITQMVDLQYFDFRIGVLFWIFTSGLICIVKQENLYIKGKIKY